MSFGVFQFRRGTAAQWTSANTILAAGELGLETDTAKFKVGDGSTAWNSLAYGGIQGTTGATGPGVATGGTANQALTKIDSTNYNTQWSSVILSGATAGGDLAGTYPNPTIKTALNDPAAATPGLRTLGTGATQATAGNDSRLSDSRIPTGTAGGGLNGTYPNPNVDLVPWPPVTLTFATTVATDASLSNHFRCTLTADCIIGTPTNPTDGQRLLWELMASGGDRTPTLSAGFVMGSSGVVISTITSGTTDYIGAMYNSTAAVWRVIAYAKGY